MSAADRPAVAGVAGEVVAAGVHRTRVQWIDTDASGLYHNTTVARFVESAEAALFADRGIDGYFPVAPRVRYEASFDAPLRFGQEATAVVALVELGERSMTFEFEIWGEPFRGRPRVRAAHGRYVTVHVTGPPADEIRSAPWPAAWVAALTDTAPTDTPLTDTPLTDTALTDTPLTDTPLTDTPLTDTADTPGQPGAGPAQSP